ncbi:hypothetical protein Mal48_33980 [Thalassoglobus polymorphus]|uniref:Uncharacterized protein n=1 Tax=Thalassoglobus polymorphus TaxID=2527994 RepID=A0A517QRA2_9PLAN|nr:hypothetical protein Mal48_33980 [Thalassoglobus polymorphus]
MLSPLPTCWRRVAVTLSPCHPDYSRLGLSRFSSQVVSIPHYQFKLQIKYDVDVIGLIP